MGRGDGTPRLTPSAQRGTLGLFAVTSVVTASLLFVVQPMVARMVLPAFGGSPQVWTTSMLFFQVALLAGYGYTHVATTRLRADRQPLVHLALLLPPLALLPIALAVVPSGAGGIAPAFELLLGLTLGVAAPFVLVATSGPLLQRWFSWTDHPQASDPYVLYAAGNVGSIGGLLAYPFVLEPALTVVEQARLWAAGYVVAVGLVAVCAAVALRGRARRPDAVDLVREPSPPVGRRRATRWVLLALVPSTAMLSTTTYLSTDIAAVPMLWVLPLALYLATFVVAFGRFGPAATRAATWLAPPVAVAALVVRPGTAGLIVAVAVQLALVTVAGLLAHGRLSADRPPPAQLTRFYVLLAVGGALGGLANGILAPLLLPVVLEHGLLIAALAWMVAQVREIVPGVATLSPPTRVSAGLLVCAIPLLAFLIGYDIVTVPGGGLVTLVVLLGLLALLASALGRSGAAALSIAGIALLPGIVTTIRADHVDRTFFGVHRVIVASESVELLHGTTLHGSQDLSSPQRRRVPLTYYAPDGPFGDLAAAFGDRGDLGVIGLGAGSVAAYGSSGQRVVYHEIDPSVVDIAWERFSFLADSDAEIEVVLGDGRLTVAAVDGAYGLLAVDAFSSDSIPVHLLTIEAIATYLDALTDDGVLALHISNRYLDLRPVAAGTAAELGLDVVIGTTRRGAVDALPANWVALAPPDGRLDALRELGWDDLEVDLQPWTDQRSDLWSVVSY